MLKSFAGRRSVDNVLHVVHADGKGDRAHAGDP